MGQDLGAVDAPPHKGVVGDLVELVPGQLGGHEVVDAALAHDLGQRARIAEHVGQPQDAVVHAEFFLEEALAVDELPHQAFAAGQVAVGFHPHAALGFPAALFHPGLDLVEQFGVALFEEVVQLGLAGHELVVGVLLHQAQHGGKAAADLLLGLGHGPPPGHVDVGVADAAGDDLVVAGQVGVQRLGQVGAGFGHAGVEAVVIGRAQVQQVDRLVEHPLQVVAGLAVGVQPGEALQGHDHVEVQALDLGVDLPQVHQQAELGVHDAGVGLQVQAVGLAALGLLGQQHVPVVHVDALGDHAVHKQQKLGVLGVVPFVDLGLHVQEQGLAVQFGGHRDPGREPVVLVGAVPVHGAPVKVGVGRGVAVRLFGAQELAGLDVPVGGGVLLLDAERFQFFANAVDAFVQKFHIVSLSGAGGRERHKKTKVLQKLRSTAKSLQGGSCKAEGRSAPAWNARPDNAADAALQSEFCGFVFLWNRAV